MADQPVLGGDLLATAAGLGVDLSGLQGSVEEEDEGWVYEGEKHPRSRWRPGTTGDLDYDVNDLDQTRSVPEYKKDFFRKNPGELPSLQRRLWEAGFYDGSVDWEDIPQGDYDDDTKKAWERAIGRAAAFYDAGKKLTLDEVIEMSRRQRAGLLGEDGAGGRGSGRTRAPLSVRVSHPEDIRTVAMQVSTKILGRGWGEDELNRFVNTYQSMERAAQTGAYNAEIRGGTSTAAPDVATAAASAARASNPVAAEATDVVGAYSLLLEAMGSLGAT